MKRQFYILHSSKYGNYKEMSFFIPKKASMVFIATKWYVYLGKV
jgi:hypothetical protein